MIDPHLALNSDHLSENEETELRKGIEQLHTVIKSYPSAKTTPCGNLKDWTRSEQWARRAMDSTHRVVSQLGLIQTRSMETRNAFISALTAYDRVMGIIESRYRHQVPEDYATAKLAMQTCIEYTKRLFRERPATADEQNPQTLAAIAPS